MRNRISIAILVLVALMTLGKSPVFSMDVGTIACAVLLMFLCLGPAVFWVHRGMKTIPLFEVYAAAHLTYYWLPVLKADYVIWQVPVEFRIKLLLIICLYLGSGAVAYYSWQQRMAQTGGAQSPFWNRQIDSRHARGLFWAGLGLWVLWQYALVADWVPDLGTAFGIVRAAVTIMGSIAIFHLATAWGQGTLPGWQRIAFLAVLVAGVIFVTYSGFLVTGTITFANALFAYALGSKRIPVFAGLAVLLVINFLNYGKGEMRQEFWGEDVQGTPARMGVWNVYSVWIKASIEDFGNNDDDEEGEGGILTRANLLQMLGIIVSQSPDELPYVNGKSYVRSLGLFVPKFLWKDRPDVHTPMQELGYYYGIHQSEDSMAKTSISLGQIAEAWANFGWIGIVVIGVFFGWFFGVGVFLSYNKPITSVGFLFGMLFTGWAINLEHSAGPLLMSFYQAVIVALIGLYFLSRPQVATDASLKPASASH
jgi:hypothetical protein